MENFTITEEMVAAFFIEVTTNLARNIAFNPLSKLVKFHMIIETEKMILKMVSGEMRPKQQYNRETKKWDQIPNEEEKYFEYLLVTDDLVGEKIVLNSKIDYSKFEGKKVIAKVGWSYNNFQKKMGALSLVEILPADKA